jgi:hypothetical protein
MATFTVYCHGTGFNSVKGREKNELVAWFHDHTEGVQAQLQGSRVTAGSYMINEGPGHGGKGGIALAQQINPITGNVKADRTLAQRINPFTSPSFADHARGNTGGTTKVAADLKGKLSGQGWDENTIRTVNIIQDLQFDKGMAIDKVNLVGWSRGAITCIRIAHLMYEVFNISIECNIIGVDPVAGMDAGLTMRDTQQLQPNVRRYVAFLAMHEMRESFKPQDWSRMVMDPANTTAIMLPMPGVHSAQVIPGAPPDSAYITRNLTAGLLKDWGTQLTSTPFGHLGTDEDMCEAYGRLVLSLSEHSSYQTKGIGSRLMGLGLRRRDFARHSKMDTYTRGGKESYWINEHHRACFQSAYPAAYNAIFERAANGQQMPVARVDFSLFQAMNNRPATRTSLMAKGLLVDQPTYTIEIGSGRYALDAAALAWPDPFPRYA